MGSRVLLVECADRPGLVHVITGVLFDRGLNVVGNQEFVDREFGRFFMRTEFDGAAEACSLLEELRGVLSADALVRLSEPAPKRIVVLASKEHHCLADILVRHTFGELNARLLAVISNHDVLSALVAKFDLPFHHVPHEGRSREAHEFSVLEVIGRYDPEFLVLAKGQSSGDFDRITEITAALTGHEVQCRSETAGCTRGGQWLLQDKVCPLLKDLMGCGLAIQNCENSGVLVAGAAAQILQNL